MTAPFVTTVVARLAAGLCLAAVAGAHAQGGYKAVHSGRGTFYDYSGGGNCSFPYTPGLLTAAMNTADYDTARACGAYIEVTDTENGETAVVRIDDRCPGCTAGDIDLTRESFARIASLDEGVIPIRWRYVSGPSTPVEVVFDDGSSQGQAGAADAGRRRLASQAVPGGAARRPRVDRQLARLGAGAEMTAS